MNNTMTKGTKPKLKESQVIGCRVPVKQWHEFEKKCIENEIKMSKVLQGAVQKFIASN